MDGNLSLHLKMFNDKIKVMNQGNAKMISLTAAEARSLHSDIFDLLNHCSTLSQRLEGAEETNTVAQINMDGGGF